MSPRLKLGPPPGAAVATQAHLALGQGDAPGHAVHAALVLPQDGLPLPVAGLVLVGVTAIAAGVADEAVDVLQLLPADLGAGLLAQAGVALGTTLGDDLAVAVDGVADPAGQGVGAEIVDGVHLAQLLALGVNDGRSLALPLVMLGMEEGGGLFLVALQTGGGALVMLEVLLVAVLHLPGRGGPGQEGDQQQRQQENCRLLHALLHSRNGR